MQNLGTKKPEAANLRASGRTLILYVMSRQQATEAHKFCGLFSRFCCLEDVVHDKLLYFEIILKLFLL